MRRATLGLAALAIAVAARGAPAQTFYLGNAQADTAVGLVPETEIQLSVRAYNPNGYYYYLSSTRLTFHYDPAAVEILGALPGSLGILDSATTSGSFTVSASGCASGLDIQPLRLRVKLKAGAVNGAYVWATADSTYLWYYCYSPYGNPFASDFSTSIGQFCTSTSLYGDVDGDGLTNSRDALMMLTYAIGLPINSTSRIAQGIPLNCPPLGAAGETVVFKREGNSGIDTLYTLAAALTTGAPVPNATGSTIANPRLAADGSSIVYRCIDSVYGYYYHICRINADGTGLADRTPDPYYFTNEGPDWSPDGTKIAFRQNYNCYPTTMDSSGANQVVTGSASCGVSIVWSRTGAQLAYTTGGSGLRVVNSDGTGDALLTTGYSDQQLVRWSPAGDTLAFVRYGNGLYVVPAAGGTAQRVVTITGFDYDNGFDWGPQGILFSIPDVVPGRRGIWLLSSLTGTIRRVTDGDDRQPSFRRNP